MPVGYRRYGLGMVALGLQSAFHVRMANAPILEVCTALLMTLSACSTSSTVRVESLDAASDAPSSDTSDSTVSQSDRCATPQPLLFVEGAVAVRGDTTRATDELSTLDCGSRGAAGPLSGPQHYYAISMRAGATYSFVLTAAFHSVLYGVDERLGCTLESMQRGCRSEGESGFASGLINPGTGGPNPGVVFDVPPDFAPDVDMDLILVVDSDGGRGAYELTVRETLP